MCGSKLHHMHAYTHVYMVNTALPYAYHASHAPYDVIILGIPIRAKANFVNFKVIILFMILFIPSSVTGGYISGPHALEAKTRRSL